MATKEQRKQAVRNVLLICLPALAAPNLSHPVYDDIEHIYRTSLDDLFMEDVRGESRAVQVLPALCNPQRYGTPADV